MPCPYSCPGPCHPVKRNITPKVKSFIAYVSSTLVKKEDCLENVIRFEVIVCLIGNDEEENGRPPALSQ